MTKQLKAYICHFFLTCCMACGICLFALLPQKLLSMISIFSLVLCAAILLIGGVILYFKRLRHLLILLMTLTPVFAFAQGFDQCAEDFKASAEQGNLCVYNALKTSPDVRALCTYMRKFNPTKSMNVQQLGTHHHHVNVADAFVDAYQNLSPAYQTDGTNCSGKEITATDGKSVKERREILQRNNTPLCCAMALQTLDQIYTSLHAERKVETVPMMLTDEKMQCWACDVIYLMIILTNTLSNRVAPAVASVGIFFLEWGLAFWLALKVGMLLLNRNIDGQSYSAPQFFKELLTRSLLVGLIAMILLPTANSFNPNARVLADLRRTRPTTLLDEAYSDVISPVFEMISGFGIQLSDSLMGQRQPNLYQSLLERVLSAPPAIRSYADKMQKVNYCTDPNAIQRSSIYQSLRRSRTLNPNVPGLITPSLTSSLLCMTQMPTRGVAPISAAGSIFTSYGITGAERLTIVGIPIGPRIPKFLYIIYGLMLTIACWWLGFTIAFRLIDIVVRLAIVVILCPLLLALAAFPITRSYSKKAFDFFLSALMGFVQLSISVGLIVPFFYRSIQTSNDTNGLLNAMVAPFNSQYVPNLYNQFTQNGFMLILYLLGICLLSTHLLKATAAFFAHFGFGSVVNQQSNATMAGALTSVRQFGGSAFDFAKGVKQRAGAFTKGKGLTGKNGSANTSAPSVNRRAWEDFKKNTKVGRGIVATNKLITDNKITRGYNAAKNKIHQGAQAVKNFALNNPISRGIRAGVNTVSKGYHGFVNFLNNNAITRFGDKVKNKVLGVTHGIGNAVSRRYTKIKSGIKNGINKVKTALGKTWAGRQYKAARNGIRQARNWTSNKYNAFKHFVKNNKVTRTAKAVGEFARNNKITRGVRHARNAVSNFAKNNMVMRGLGHVIMFAQDNKVVRGVRIIKGAMEEAGESGVGRVAKEVKDFAVDQAKKGTHQFFHPEE